MPNAIKISIPSPCHENWAAMTLVNKGKFCASCQKNVMDFTNASDREILAVIKAKNVCGRFKSTQIERALVIPKEKNSLWLSATAAAITLLTIGNNTTFAQTPINTEQAENKTDDIKLASNQKSLTITGIVIDDNQIPLPGVTVYVTNTDKFTQTDMDGNFSIEAAIGNTLHFSNIGYITQQQIINDSSNYTIQLETEVEEVNNVVFISYPIYKQDYLLGSVSFVQALDLQKKRTFFGRIFHGIGNIFR